MGAQDIITLISTVGFPIVMCGFMGYYLKYTHDDHRKDIKELQAQQQKQQEAHKEEMAQLVQAINNNTNAMERIFDLKEYVVESREIERRS